MAGDPAESRVDWSYFEGILGKRVTEDKKLEIITLVNGHADRYEVADMLLDYYEKESPSLDESRRVDSTIFGFKCFFKDGGTPVEQPLSVIDAFSIPKFHFDPVTNSFSNSFCIHKHRGPFQIYGDASANTCMYKDRFHLLSKKLSNFQQYDTNGNYKICQIQSLKQLPGINKVMGVMSKSNGGHFYLEDLTAAVKINLSSTKKLVGYFSENTIVLAQGELQPDGIFKVKFIHFPPFENRRVSVSSFNKHDYFDDGVFNIMDYIRRAYKKSKEVNVMFVILMDIWLDKEETMVKLGKLLDAYEECEVVPYLFILMGNFCSVPFSPNNSSSSISSNFGELGRMIKSHTRLNEDSRFLFIPGPHDAGPSRALPRCALPEYITKELRIPNAIFGSNPCRIKFYTQEIVVFRADILCRIKESCLVPPSDFHPFTCLATTITGQNHLCPLPLSMQPIIWNYDHSLHLYPLPHTLVLGDGREQKTHTEKSFTCFNSGSFSNDYLFVEYQPYNKAVKSCHV